MKRIFSLAVIAVLSLVGCAGPEQHARTALDVTAHAVVAADAVVAPIYDARADEALEAALAAHPDVDEDDAVRADYRERMRRLDAVVVALRASRTSLLDAQTVVDADRGNSVVPTLGCVGVAIVNLAASLRDAGLDPPPKLANAIDSVGALAALVCDDGGGS